MIMQNGRSSQKFIRVLCGEPIWPPPVWLMRQAGRYLPEYRKVRAKAGNFMSLCTTPGLATEATLQPIRRFGLDAAILFSDILILPWGMGQNLHFAEGEGPRLTRLETMNDVRSLSKSRLKLATEPVMETVSRVRAELPSEITLIGFAGSPFTVACYMLDGRGGNFPVTRSLVYGDPPLVSALINTVTEATIDYLSDQIRHGADCVMLFDSWAGILPPDLFRQYVVQPTARITESISALHPDIRVIGFPRLAGLMAIPYAAKTGIAGLGMDTAVDPAILGSLLDQAKLKRPIALQGNLDPVLLRSGGAVLEDSIEQICHACAGRPHIFNLGHGVLPDTPPEHVEILIRVLRELEQPLEVASSVR